MCQAASIFFMRALTKPGSTLCCTACGHEADFGDPAFVLARATVHSDSGRLPDPITSVLLIPSLHELGSVMVHREPTQGDEGGRA